ncbi:hypothetical protein F7725_019121 [Dissostichus mawsoni]|uniref:Uncharacterized protein n=1 Tax=Dissostichus mawsoni TaxID=36200 RepID=A0A7J5XTF8_DISMA|nr:hypothetical protein F7725_019121 [Dissostichus mawsoni]
MTSQLNPASLDELVNLVESHVVTADLLKSTRPGTEWGRKQVLPDRKTFAKELEKEYAIMEKELRKTIDAQDYVSTTADIWSANSKGFLGVTVHWIDADQRKRGQPSARPILPSLEAPSVPGVINATLNDGDDTSVLVPADEAEQQLEAKAATIADLHSKRELERRLEKELERELEKRLERGLERRLERRLERELEKRLERGLERGLERELERRLERGLGRGLERGLERELERGLERRLERGLERRLERDWRRNLRGNSRRD